jgi:hypothetical protein
MLEIWAWSPLLLNCFGDGWGDWREALNKISERNLPLSVRPGNFAPISLQRGQHWKQEP